MNILITNDDGAQAAQLVPLIRWCQTKGNVTVVVPKYEQSAKSHSIEIRKAYEIKQVELAPGIPAWTVDSAPADCIRFANKCLDTRFDLVISGVNRGYNLGQDIMYSGTFAAASEAVNKGMKAIALSTSIKYYDQALGHMDEIFRYIEENRLLELHDLYNINIPVDPKGFRITRQGGPSFSEDFAPIGNDLYEPTGVPRRAVGTDIECDIGAVAQGYISVSPMTTDRTDLTMFRKLYK